MSMTGKRDEAIAGIRAAIDRDRLVRTAVQLIEVPSPTLQAGAVAERLADILNDEGFAVERPVAGWPDAPAVVARFDSGSPGPTLQFSGHLDTVHLPFVPPSVKQGELRGSGAADMKGGLAAAVEAMRALRDTATLDGGSILFTAYDHHEGPWGDRRQLHALIDEGYAGDAVLIPEYLAQPLPLVGRGSAIFHIRLSRDGDPVHEVFRQHDQPDVLLTGAELVCGLNEMNELLRTGSDSATTRDSVFVGSIVSGEMYNQSPNECRISGTRRWVKPGIVEAVREAFQSYLDDFARKHGVSLSVEYHVSADAFRIDAGSTIVSAFQDAHEVATGRRLDVGEKPFVDDGNSFASRAGVPALTHGPNASGAHTQDECVPVDELVRIARVYALTARFYCGGITPTAGA